MPLVFPGSDSTQADKDPNEVQFRDGKRQLAPYLVALLGALDTERYTYDEAITLMNSGLAADHVGRAFDRILERRR